MKPQDVQSVPGAPSDKSVDRLADLIESNLNDVAGSAADFSQTSHVESTHTDELADA